MDSKRLKTVLTLFTALSLAAGMSWAAGGGDIVKADPSKHFDAKGKPPSDYTVELQNALRQNLPFEDKRDFEEAKKRLHCRTRI